MNGKIEHKKMDKNAIIETLNELRAEIEKELSVNQSGNLVRNYEHGIKLCNDMIASVKHDNLTPTFESLFSKFNRYAVDSLPWTGEIMKIYDKSQEIIKREYSRK